MGGRGRPFDRGRQHGATQHRRNERIRAREVRVIGPDGKQVGIMLTPEAIRLARQMELDLVEVSPNAEPPVCRILNYGKFIYEESKKQKDSKATTAKIKEVKFRTRIEQHDYLTKTRRAEQFLYKGTKIKITLSFRGREMEHTELGFEVVKRAIADLSGVATPDHEPRLNGRNINLIMSPLPQNKRKLKLSETETDDLDDDDDDEDEDDKD